MFFDKKNKKGKRCENCGISANEKYKFCPQCGNNFADLRKERKDFGLLGKDDFSEPEMGERFAQGFGITDKLIGSMFNSVMKSLDKQFKNQFKEMERDFERAEVKTFPNGIRIKIAGPFWERPENTKKRKKVLQNREVDEEQIKKMNTLPREKAKTSVKRIGDKVVYELLTPGVSALEDVFVSKLESGYEVKAIGNKKVYINSVPINLPLTKYSILKNKLLIEFAGREG